MGLFDAPAAPLQQVTRGRESIAWLGDSLTANDSTPSSLVFSLTSSVAAGATSVTVTSPYNSYGSQTTPSSGMLLVLDPNTGNEETVVISASTGIGPYTFTVPALTKAHATGAVARTAARLWQARSVPMLTQILSNGRLRFGGVYAHGGYTAQQVQTVYLPQVIAAKPAVCVVCLGTNPTSPNAAPTLSDISSYIIPIWKSLLAAGILPVVQLLPPKNTLVAGNAYIIGRFNARLAYEARLLGLSVYDVYSQLVDPGSGVSQAGGYQTTLNTDDTHPSELGARVWAQGLVDLLDDTGVLRPTDPFLFTSNNYGGDPTSFPAAFSTNAVMLTDTNADGIPDSWSKNSNTGNVGDVYSLTTLPGVVGKVLTITRAAAGTNDPVFSSGTWTGIPGHKYQFSCKVKTSGVDAAFKALIGTTGNYGGNTTSSFAGWDLRVTNAVADTDNLFSMFAWKTDIANVSTIVGEYVHPSGLSSDILSVRLQLRGDASTPQYSVSVGQVSLVDLSAIGVS